jgi:hypothetical protein
LTLASIKSISHVILYAIKKKRWLKKENIPIWASDIGIQEGSCKGLHPQLLGFWSFYFWGYIGLLPWHHALLFASFSH